MAPGAPVVIQARGADDSNGDPLTHTWAATSIAGNVRDTGTTELSVTPALPGVYTLSHEATDPLGVRSTFESEVVVVGDGPAVAVRVAPAVAVKVVAVAVAVAYVTAIILPLYRVLRIQLLLELERLDEGLKEGLHEGLKEGLAVGVSSTVVAELDVL